MLALNNQLSTHLDLTHYGDHSLYQPPRVHSPHLSGRSQVNKLLYIRWLLGSCRGCKVPLPAQQTPIGGLCVPGPCWAQNSQQESRCTSALQQPSSSAGSRFRCKYLKCEATWTGTTEGPTKRQGHSMLGNCSSLLKDVAFTWVLIGGDRASVDWYSQGRDWKEPLT